MQLIWCLLSNFYIFCSSSISIRLVASCWFMIIVVCINSISPMAIGCFICVNINLIIVLIDISIFVMSEGILFKMLVLGINEMVFDLASEVWKDYSLFLIYKANIFLKLLKLNLMPMWLYFFFVIYFCGMWAFSSSRKHLLITLLRLEFVVSVLYFPIYSSLCNYNWTQTTKTSTKI